MKRPPVPAEWIRTKADRVAVSRDYYFDEAKGRFVCDFIERFCRQSHEDWRGKPLELEDWQRDWVMRLFGWRRPDGRRRFKQTYVEVPKKNGKSTLVSALVLFFLIADSAGGPQIYLNACDRDQARIVYEEAAKMVAQSPGLSSRLGLVDSRNRIVNASNDGVIVANSAEVDSKDGRNASHVVFDEVHRFPVDGKLYRVFRYAGAARLEPLEVVITTAGESEAGVWFELRTLAEKLIRGESENLEFLGVVYRADPDDDVDDPRTWYKANPSLGSILSEESFRNDLEAAKETPVQFAEFKRLRLGIITRTHAGFVDMVRWKACSDPPTDLKRLRRAPCYLGLDGASVNDLAALAALFPLDDFFDLHLRFYLPKDNILALEREHRQPYRVWAEAGLITLTPGAAIDYEFIRADVKRFAREHDVKACFVDPCNTVNLYTNLKEYDGIPVEMLRQGAYSLNSPSKELLRLVLTGALRHGGNAILDWHAGNAVGVLDANHNVRLDKKKSREKIDGMAATVNAVAAWMNEAITGKKPSIYERRGPRCT